MSSLSSSSKIPNSSHPRYAPFQVNVETSRDLVLVLAQLPFQEVYSNVFLADSSLFAQFLSAFNNSFEEVNAKEPTNDVFIAILMKSFFQRVFFRFWPTYVQ